MYDFLYYVAILFHKFRDFCLITIYIASFYSYNYIRHIVELSIIYEDRKILNTLVKKISGIEFRKNTFFQHVNSLLFTNCVKNNCRNKSTTILDCGIFCPCWELWVLKNEPTLITLRRILWWEYWSECLFGSLSIIFIIKSSEVIWVCPVFPILGLIYVIFYNRWVVWRIFKALFSVQLLFLLYRYHKFWYYKSLLSLCGCTYYKYYLYCKVVVFAG